jgi:LSD1 subclass zinc finger protein
MEIFNSLERTVGAQSSVDAFLALIEAAGARGADAANARLMARVTEAGGLSPIEEAVAALRAKPPTARFSEVSAFLDRSADPAFEGIWMRESACRQVLNLIRGSSNVRFSFNAAFRPCLTFAVDAAGRENDVSVTFVTPNAEVARLMSGLVRLLDLSGSITVEEGWPWGHREQVGVEVLFPPFALDVRDDATIPKPVLASIGVTDAQAVRLTAENVSLAYALECLDSPTLLATTDSELFRMVGVEPIIRRNLLESGRLVAVMGVPGGLAFSNTAVRTNMIVLSDEDEKYETVRFVDLGHETAAQRGRRGRLEVSPGVGWSDLLKSAPRADEGLTRDVTHEEIVANNTVLLPDRYLNTGPRIRINRLLETSEVVTLAEAVDLVRPVSLTKDAAGDYTLRESAPSDINDRGFVGEPSRNVGVDRAKYVKAYNQQLRPGDLVIAVKGNVGTIAMVPGEVPGDGEQTVWTAGQSMMILRPKKRSGISQLTLYEYLSNTTVQAFIRSLAGGAAIQSLAIKDLKSLPVPVPDPETAARIEAGFAERMAIFERIDELKKQLKEVHDREWPHAFL